VSKKCPHGNQYIAYLRNINCACAEQYFEAREAERLAARAVRDMIHESDGNLYEFSGTKTTLDAYDAARKRVDEMEGK
jgi:hypothetical protein